MSTPTILHRNGVYAATQQDDAPEIRILFAELERVLQNQDQASQENYITSLRLLIRGFEIDPAMMRVKVRRMLAELDAEFASNA